MSDRIDDCPLCASIQSAVVAERLAVEGVVEAGEPIGYRLLAPGPDEGISEDAVAELSVRRDEYDRARSRRLRVDNRFFAVCPRCGFDLQSARRELESWRRELPWCRSTEASAVESARLRATGS